VPVRQDNQPTNNINYWYNCECLIVLLLLCFPLLPVEVNYARVGEGEQFMSRLSRIPETFRPTVKEWKSIKSVCILL